MGRCERLKWNRKKLGLSQAELAKKIGVSQKTISKLETDETAWAVMKDRTTDAVDGMLRKLGSWQCDINSIFKETATDIDISEMRKKVREKRIQLSMSQKELAELLDISIPTLSKFENHDSYWGQKTSTIPAKLIKFVEGGYDREDEIVKEEEAVKVEIKPEMASGHKPESHTIPGSVQVEPVEDTLNSIIDILQDRMRQAGMAGKDTNVYVHMIGGLCEEYLRGVD